MAVVGEDRRGRLTAPAGEAGEPVGAVADECEPVRYGRRADPVTGPDAVFVGDYARAAVELDNPLGDDALGQVLVGSADEHLVDAGVFLGNGSSGRESVVGLELDHRPDSHSERLERLLQEWEL